MEQTTKRPGGRRPGTSGTREAILEAARASFADLGYTATTIRGIAATVGVDPALVRHFYGCKEQLFAAAAELPVDLAVAIPELSRGDPTLLAERLVRFYLNLWADPVTGGPLLATFRSAISQERAATLIRDFLGTQVIGHLGVALSDDRPEIREALVSAHLMGVVLARWVVRVPPLADVDLEDLIAWLTPTIQAYLTGDLPDRAVAAPLAGLG